MPHKWLMLHFQNKRLLWMVQFELIRLLIVTCGMLVHSSSMTVQSCWILAGTDTCCCLRRSRASQTCPMGDMSGVHARTGMFAASKNCLQIFAAWGCASCCNLRWCSWICDTTMGLKISSWYVCAFRMPSIKCTSVLCPWQTPAQTITPPPMWVTRSTTSTS